MDINNFEDEYVEYETFFVTSKDGEEVELAIVDEFDFEEKHYVVGALIEGDTISDDGVYIYRAVVDGDEFHVEKIDDEQEYARVIENWN